MIKLVKKERTGAKIKRTYDRAKTPYLRLLESDQISEKESLIKMYQSLNPAELKRVIDKKLDILLKIYQKKNNRDTDSVIKKLTPSLVSFSHVMKEKVSVS